MLFLVKILKMRLFIICLLFGMVCSCSLKKQDGIDIETGIEHLSRDLKCSDFITHIEYIPLQTTDDILINDNPTIVVVDKYIIVKTIKECFLFSKDTGKFIRKVGNYGNGPGEYHSTSGFINPTKKTIYFAGWNSVLMEFSFDGEYISSIKIPGYNDSFTSPSSPTNHIYWNDYFVSYFTNSIGIEKKLIQIFDHNGEIIKVIPNRNVYMDTKNFSFTTGESDFYYYDNNLFFKETYSDTIFKISDQVFSPHIIFHTGKYSKPYESKWLPLEKRGQYINLRKINETPLFIFFKVFDDERQIFGLYNKKNERLKMAERKYVENDVDYFLPFSPESLSDIGEGVSFIEAYQVVQWFSENSEKADKLPEHLKKLSNVKETDNQVVLIAKLKEF